MPKKNPPPDRASPPTVRDADRQAVRGRRHGDPFAQSPDAHPVDDVFRTEQQRSGTSVRRVAPPGAPSLDTRTLDVVPGTTVDRPAGPHWEVTVYGFGDGDAECTALRVLEPRGKKKEQGTRRRGLRSEMSDEDRVRSLVRARRNLRHKTMMMRADRMLTLTKRGGFEDVRDLYVAWDRFRRSCAKAWPGFRAVVVPELHLGGDDNHGTYHMHVALDRFYNVNLMRYFWHKALGADRVMRGDESPGNIDIRRGKKGPQMQRAKLARYLAKYIGKGMEGQNMNAKRFTTCGHIPEPEKVKFFVPCGDDVLFRVQRTLEGLTGSRMRGCFRVPDTVEMAYVMTTY